MQAIFNEISSHGIAETVEEIGADADERKIDPRFVADKVGEGLEGEFFGADGLQALFG